MQIMHNQSFYAQYQSNTLWVVIIVITSVITMIFQYIRPSQSHRVNKKKESFSNYHLIQQKILVFLIENMFKILMSHLLHSKLLKMFWNLMMISRNVRFSTTSSSLLQHDDFSSLWGTYWFVLCSNKKKYKWKYGTNAWCQRSLYCVRSTFFHVYLWYDWESLCIEYTMSHITCMREKFWQEAGPIWRGVTNWKYNLDDSNFISPFEFFFPSGIQ